MSLHTQTHWVDQNKTNWESPVFSDVGRDPALKKTPSVKQAETSSAYKILFLAMRICGLFYYTPRTAILGIKVSGSIIYHAFIFILIWTNVLRFFSTYNRDEVLGPTLVRKVLIHVFYFQCAMCITSSSILSYRRKQLWKKHRHYAERYHESSDDNRRCSRRRLYAATTLCVLFITTTVSIVIYQYVKTPEELLSDFHLMHHDDSVQPWHLVIMAGMSVVTLYSACAWSLPLACLIISCLLARDRFRRFEKDLVKTISDGRLAVDGVLEGYRQRFQQLCSIILEVDNIFSLYNLMVYVTNIPIVCLLLYVLILDDSPTQEMRHCVAANVIFIFTCLLQIILVTVVATMLNQAAVSCKSSLYNLNLKGECCTLEHFMQYYAFLTKLTEGHIGLSGWKLFYINKQTIKTVTLMIVSYTVILLKFGNRETSGDTLGAKETVYIRLYNSSNG